MPWYRSAAPGAAEEVGTMRDHELYATIFGVQAPRAVERDVDVAGGGGARLADPPRRRPGAVPGVPDGVPDLRPSRPGVAASRHVSAPDPLLASVPRVDWRDCPSGRRPPHRDREM